jgi:hypothetical protein
MCIATLSTNIFVLLNYILTQNVIYFKVFFYILQPFISFFDSLAQVIDNLLVLKGRDASQSDICPSGANGLALPPAVAGKSHHGHHHQCIPYTPQLNQLQPLPPNI